MIAAAGPAAGRPVDAATTALAQQVRTAAAEGRSLRIRGGDSKAFYGAATASDTELDTRLLCGILDYEPSELVLTARAGTPLVEIEQALAERGQMLGFEPPRFSSATTLGGVVAAGLSGPARPFRGSARDFVLGVELVNGHGEVLRFGGQVMKNVAGYDVSRLQCGALGTLGVLTRVSLRVVPRPAREATLSWPAERAEAAARMVALQAKPWPTTGLAHVGNRLYQRVSGSAAAIDDAVRRLAPERVEETGGPWDDLRDHAPGVLGDAAAGRVAWRLALPPAAPDPDGYACTVVDWGGALRWVAAAAGDGAALASFAARHGGHAQAFRGAVEAHFATPPPALAALMQRVKQAFDPARVFNPGRLYPWL
ncbi:MAG: glycolate oxidase subunit GlcE [Gammaproteobacteria bacterium]|nr:glycolate oxidase subunit GlcE [Gammaproteobacteria bacterium]